MAEKITFETPIPPSRSQRIHEYIDSFSQRDLETARDIADQIFKIEQPLAQCQVLIPVAAHQEAAQIDNALAQYARQDTNQPFSVVLSLNSPLSQKNNPGIIDTLDQIEKSKKAHPQLDVRTAMTFYERPTIGMIRRDLWNGALLASTYSGRYDQPDDEIIGINHDIDLASMSPRYIERVQHHYLKKQRHYAANGLKTEPLPPSSTLIKHAFSPLHPNISKGAYWADFSIRATNGSSEAGLVVPMSHYARVGGFSVNANTYETRPLFEDRPTDHSIAGTIMQTSPRRYIERLQHGFDSIWTTESFGDSDSCREQADRPDLSLTDLETAMLQNNYLTHTLQEMAHAAINTYLAGRSPLNYNQGDELSTEMIGQDLLELTGNLVDVSQKQLLQGVKILDRVIKSERLTRHASDLYVDTDLVVDIVLEHFPGLTKE